MRARAPFLLAAALAAGLCSTAQALELENIQIGLSTDRVTITPDFSGADLTIFGSVENVDPLVSRQGRYDVVVVLEGPPRPVVVRRRDRILGVWINTEAATFLNVPASYSVATTRAMQDITDPEGYRRLSLGSDNIFLQPADPNDPAVAAEFGEALRQEKERLGLYTERPGDVEFLSQNLFRARLTLSPDVPVGTHKARAFLFRNGVFIRESSAQLAIRKSGFEQTLFRLSQNHGLFYGLCSVALAIATGWLGRVMFRKD